MIKVRIYTKNGLRFIEVDIDEFQIKYFDNTKKSATYKNYISGGFFAPFSEPQPSGKKILYTLPVMNLMADIYIRNTKPCAIRYLDEWTKGNAFKINRKVKYSCSDSPSLDFKNREISTLVITADNKAYIKPLNSIPSNAKYSVSGIITMENGLDVDYKNYVVGKQGVGGGTVYKTYRNWLALGNGKITIISGKSTTYNYILSAEIFRLIKKLGLPFTDIIGLDGGGSYISKVSGVFNSYTLENRPINNIITF